MQPQLTLLSIAPILAFMTADRCGARRSAVPLALFVSGLEVLYNSFQLGFMEYFSLSSFALFLVLGGISVHRRDPLYFKLQPVAFEILVAGTLFFYAFVLDTPLLAVILLDHVGVNAWVPVYERGYVEIYAQTLSKSVPFLLLLHAALTAHGALRRSTWWWFNCRVLGLYVMITVLFLSERIFQATY